MYLCCTLASFHPSLARFAPHFFFIFWEALSRAANISYFFFYSTLHNFFEWSNSSFRVHMHQSSFTELFASFLSGKFSHHFSYVVLCFTLRVFIFVRCTLTCCARQQCENFRRILSVRHPHTLHNVEFSCTDFSPDLVDSSCMCKFGPFHYHSNILQRRFFFEKQEKFPVELKMSSSPDCLE